MGRGRGRGRGSGSGSGGSEFESDAGDGASARIFSCEGIGNGFSVFGVYLKDKSLLAASATSSFSSSPFVGPKLHRSGLCFASASLNFLI